MNDNHENVNKLLKEAGERVAGLVAATVDLYKQIKWKTVVFEIPENPEPSHRPRLSGYRVCTYLVLHVIRDISINTSFQS